jgi:hypothetical protein
MAYSFKVYISDGKEYFEYGNGQKITKKSFAFSQSLMDILYLDIWSFSEVFNRMGENLYSLYSDKDPKLVEEIKDDLDTLSKVHVYFEFLRLEWLNKLEQAEKKGFQDIVDLLPCKKLTHLPINLATIQRQLMALWNHVLDILSSDEPMQKKMADYYNPEKYRKPISPEVFEFQPLHTSFEAVNSTVFTEVLYPKSIYDIIDFFVRECIRREVRFRVCKYCNQFFALTGHANTEYCDRPLDSEGHTCKEMGALRLWEKKKAETPALKAYSKAYKKRFAWIKYGKITKEAFYEWSEEARKKRELCIKGGMTLEEFRAWLDD